MEYMTVKQEGHSTYTEKKSEFLSYVRPVTTEEEALSFIGEIKSMNADATHNVYAYVVRENNLQRYTDDGEPSGTAGMPVLDAIRKRGLVDVAVVVTRYFGGTLLGTGGLVRCYGKCAVQGITAAVPIIRRLCEIYEVECDYTQLGKVQYAISTSEYRLEDTVYEEDVRLIVCVEQGNGQRFINEMVEVCAGKVKIKKTEEKYIDIAIEEK